MAERCIAKIANEIGNFSLEKQVRHTDENVK